MNKRGFYSRLAAMNIRRNKRVYLPYLLTCICAVAMFYMIYFITWNEGIEKIEGGDDVRSIMGLGIAVIGIFSFVFLIYSNHFVMKQRKKELALYHILGLEKGHIRRMLFVESLYTAVISLAGGCAGGIAGSKLMLLILLKILRLPVLFGFYISGKGLLSCAVLFGVIFLVILLDNCRRIHMVSPIELLNSQRAGEKIPKARWLTALAGFFCIGCGYYLAVTTESPLAAMMVFFIAILLVIAGTYLLFIAGSVAILTVLKKRKRFYYKTRNFTSISGLIYRMKQNAAGLASICILSTAVLLMVSSTMSLYIGMKDIMDARFPREVQISFNGGTDRQREEFSEGVHRLLEENQVPYKDITEVQRLSDGIVESQGRWEWMEQDNITEALTGIKELELISEKQYEKISGRPVSLKDNEVLFFSDAGGKNRKTVTIEGMTFQVAGTLEEAPFTGILTEVLDTYFLVANDQAFERIKGSQDPVYGSEISLSMGFNLEGTDEEKIRISENLSGQLKEQFSSMMNTQDDVSFYLECRQASQEMFNISYGGLFFLGIFLGLLFLLATALIIYYKQVSEGYEDRERFQIMQKVGMNKKEVHQSIRRQIWMVFFLPLGMAVIHITAAFPLVKKMLAIMNLYQTRLFVACTVGTILAFAVIYGIIYWITARTYYRIVH